MCKRTCRDPLLQAFLQTYGLNLLQVPREDASIGDLYSVLGGRVLPPGRIAAFLMPAPRLPRTRVERLAQLAGVISDTVSLDVGLSLLEGFVGALTGGAVVGQLQTQYKAESVRRLQFRIEEAMREYVDTAALGRALMGCRTQAGHPLAGGQYRHYLTVGVVRTSCLIVRAETEAGKAVDLEGKVVLTGRGKGSVTAERRGEGEIGYQGSSRLAIGVELVELDFDSEDAFRRFKPQAGPMRVRGDERAFIGSPDGDAFVLVG